MRVQALGGGGRGDQQVREFERIKGDLYPVDLALHFVGVGCLVEVADEECPGQRYIGTASGWFAKAEKPRSLVTNATLEVSNAVAT